MSNLNNILKKDPYENCFVRARSGEIMFYCNKRRAMWYVNRNLASILNEDPLEVQLTFEPKGLGNAGDKFYIQVRKNQCCVCGTTNNLTRHHIIPVAFRHHFPPSLKDNSYHDVIPLCSQHHEEYETHAHTFKLKLAEKYNAPVDGTWLTCKQTYKDKCKARMMARSLIKHGNKIPADRMCHLIDKIKTLLIVDYIDLEELEEVANMSIDPPKIKTQGETVVAALGDIEPFIMMWRKHFIETMQPRFMPENWSVERTGR